MTSAGPGVIILRPESVRLEPPTDLYPPGRPTCDGVLVNHCGAARLIFVWAHPTVWRFLDRGQLFFQIGFIATFIHPSRKMSTATSSLYTPIIRRSAAPAVPCKPRPAPSQFTTEDEPKETACCEPSRLSDTLYHNPALPPLRPFVVSLMDSHGPTTSCCQSC